MTTTHQIKIKDFKTLAHELQLKERGSYYKCICPVCSKKEAYINKSNLHYINCSRKNNCGQSTYVYYDNMSNLNLQLSQKKENIENKDEVIGSMLEYYFNHCQSTRNMRDETKIQKIDVLCYFTKTRGISYQTILNSGIEISFGGLTLPWIAKNLSPYMDAKKFSTDNKYFNKYDVMFAVVNEQTGRYDRLIFRSTKKVKLKELQFKLYNDAQQFIILQREGTDVTIVESILDGLALIEMGYKGAVLCSLGVNSSIGAVKQFDFTPYKKRLIMFDNDEAGAEYARKVKKLVQNSRIVDNENYKKYKDLNEMLLKTKGVR